MPPILGGHMEHADNHQLQRVFAAAELIYDQTQVVQAISQMSEAINQQLADTHPVVLTVLVGGIVLTGQLLPKLHFPLQLDYIHATRYQGGTSGGAVAWRAKPSTVLHQRTVLIVDDILDGGHTLMEVIAYCKQQQAARVYTAVLLDKQQAREPGCIIQADFTGLTVDKRYVFGYGMDYQEGLRNAPGIYAVSDRVSRET